MELEEITDKKNSIFVFESDEFGKHISGNAKTALNIFGAEYGFGYGLKGRSYALPTKDMFGDSLMRSEIEFYVDQLIKIAKTKKRKIFYISEFENNLVNEMFKEKKLSKNVILI